MADPITINVDNGVTLEVLQPNQVVVDIEVIGKPGPTGQAGTTDHGLLIGLTDDDHPQYLNQTRADQRYAIIGATQVDFPSPLSVWNIDIGHVTNVVVIDSAGSVVEPGNIIYSGTSMQLKFSAAFSGTAYCF